MQWQIEWLNSLTWIGRTFLLAAAGFAIVVIGLTHFTRWGRQVRTLAWAYFSPRRSWRPLAAFALILLLAIAAVRLNVLLSYWNKGFYDSIQALDPSAFWFFMRLFGVLATLNVARVLLAYYVSQAFEIRWRTWLNDLFTENWFAGSAYYRTQFLDQPIDNPDQRVQVDIGTFVTCSRTLAIGAVDAVVSLIEFS